MSCRRLTLLLCYELNVGVDVGVDVGFVLEFDVDGVVFLFFFGFAACVVDCFDVFVVVHVDFDF